MALSQVLLAFYVGITTKPTPVWSTEPLRVLQDLNLLNPSLLIPTWFPVESSWPILAQTLYMEMEAPPVPRTPLCCISPGPRGPISIYRYISTYISIYINVYIDIYQTGAVQPGCVACSGAEGTERELQCGPSGPCLVHLLLLWCQYFFRVTLL